ncbi:MAG: MFS transporter [Pseudomonadota bacterium]
MRLAWCKRRPDPARAELTADRRLKGLTFTLVVTGYINIYLPQPVLPVLQAEFGLTPGQASLAVSLFILGFGLGNLPLGWLADRLAPRPLLIGGGLLLALGGLGCALAPGFAALAAARLVQGLALPAVTTCLAAHLSRSLPMARLNRVMAAYVAATVAGGMLGRLFGGWIFPAGLWRWSFVLAAMLVGLAVAAALVWLPPAGPPPAQAEPRHGFLDLLRRPEIRRIYGIIGLAFSVFAAVFNYLPFLLAGPPFLASTRVIALMYLSYLVGMVAAPLGGRAADRWGAGATISAGAGVLAASLGLSLWLNYAAVFLAMAGVCLGFFAVHAAAAGALNRHLRHSQGRGNSLYVLCYYLGGTAGISLGGYLWGHWGWPGVVGMGLTVLAAPVWLGLAEHRGRQKPDEQG